MPKTQTLKFLSWEGGINSEASPVNAPEKDLLECLNVKLNRNGSLERRAGFDFLDTDDIFKQQSVSLDSTAGTNSTYELWDICINSFMAEFTDILGNNKKFLLVAAGSYIYIYDLLNISNLLDISSPFQTISMLSETKYYRTNFAQDRNKIFIFNRALEHSFLEFTEAGSFSHIYAFAMVRRKSGEQSMADNEHESDNIFFIKKPEKTEYCVFQTIRNKLDCYVNNALIGGEVKTTLKFPDVDNPRSDEIFEYLYTTTVSPANLVPPITELPPQNTVIKWLFPATGEYSDQRYAWSLPVKVTVQGTLPEIQSVLKTNVVVMDRVGNNIPGQRGFGFSNGCFASGHMWCVGYHTKPNSVFFSQLIDNFSYTTKTTDKYVINSGDLNIIRSGKYPSQDNSFRYYRFYQRNDPKSQHGLGDPTDLDGGEIVIHEAQEIKNITPYRNGVLVFANNGVWYIAGNQGSFKSTSFRVEKISNSGIVSPYALAKFENIVFYFSDTGCCVITPHEQEPSSLTISTISDKIASLYTEIPNYCKELSFAYYNHVEKKLYFWYNDDDVDWIISNNKYKQPTHYRKVLIFDLALKAWYRYALEEDTQGLKPSIANMTSLPMSTLSGLEDVENNALETVTDEDLEDVTIRPLVRTITEPTTNLLFILYPNPNNSSMDWAFGTMEGPSYVDFSRDAFKHTHYDSQVVFANQNFDDLITSKNFPYIQFVFRRMETGDTDSENVDEYEGGCKARFVYDYTSSSDASPRYGELVDVYFPDRYTTSYIDSTTNGTEVVEYRHKLRGKGKSLRIELNNDEDKPFHLYGMQLLVRGTR